MRIEIEIPEEFEVDYTADKFADFLARVKADIDYNGMCGNYEREIADVLAEAFKNSKVLPSVVHEDGRLIDENEVIDVLKQTGIIHDNDLGHLVIAEINRIPTAYDVDKVVEQFEKEIEWYETHGCNNDLNRGIIGATRKAIEIVKGGGTQ